jgi:hypothetical protein
VALYVASAVIFDNEPGPGASDTTILAYYTDDGNQLKLELAFLFASIAAQEDERGGEDEWRGERKRGLRRQGVRGVVHEARDVGIELETVGMSSTASEANWYAAAPTSITAANAPPETSTMRECQPGSPSA